MIRNGARRRGGLRIAMLTASVTVVAAAVGGRMLLHLLGRDHPARHESRVAEIERRQAGVDGPADVLLTGSSFFEKWTTSERDLAPLKTTNIGIGGTKAGDHIAFFDRMVVPFAPRTLVVYIGSNDMSGLPLYSKSAEQTAELVLRYISTARERLPHTRIFYVAVTEAPARARVRDDIRSANRILAGRALSGADFAFIDTAPALLREDGSIDETLFGPDRLHFN
ncbi:MAG TPA: GDSL-type esterase/lipase family protein, partial [Microbacterium sp.]|nr:GDSL-type esterase/lipase family protein [Microbacterium sp.]